MKQENCPILLQHKKNKMVVCFKTLTSGFVLYPGETDFGICAHLTDLDYREFKFFKNLLDLDNNCFKLSKNSNVNSAIELLPIAYDSNLLELSSLSFKNNIKINGNIY
jgi:hypothetical protein